MLVDDEYMILEGLKYIIPWSQLGFEIVYTAKRGKHAIEYAQSHPVDLIITDIMMPEMTGIEMVEELSRQLEPIHTLILSGYQEFSYVKKGLDLGVKGYLIKPINKLELYEKVEQIKEELDQKKEWIQKQKLYDKSVIIRWLNEELSEGEFLDFCQRRMFIPKGPYTITLIKHYEEMTDIVSILEGKYPVLSYQSVGKSDIQTTLIYQGERMPFIQKVTELSSRYSANIFQIIVGETVPDWEKVYKSFETVKKLAAYENFYSDKQARGTVITTTQELRNQENLQFLSFDRALMIGDTETVQKEILEIFEQLIQQKKSPENVRYIAFSIFTDFYRYFPSLEKEDYNQGVNQIRDSNSIEALKEWLLHLLEKVSQQTSSNKRYSEIVQEAIALLSTSYKEELNLKNAAERLHINPVYLGQLFKKETERSFAQYLNQIRIKKSQVLLLETNQTINEIGYEVGYNTTNYFSKIFGKLNGLTPKEFREKYQNNYQSLE